MSFVFSPSPVVSVPVLGQAERFPVRRIYFVGRNYEEHGKEMGFTGREPPFFFLKPADALVGGINTLASGRVAIRTVGSYWPFATTLFDYVRRSMPTSAPQSLSNDEVYAVTAYILNLNNIVGVDSVMNAINLPNVKMPNRDGFIDLSGKK